MIVVLALVLALNIAFSVPFHVFADNSDDFLKHNTLDGNYDENQNIIEGVIRDLNEQVNKDLHYWKLEKLSSVKKSTIVTDQDGLITRYKIKLRIVQTECSKEQDRARIELNLCAVRDDAPKQVCRYLVLVNRESLKSKYTSLGCHAKKQSSHYYHEHERDNMFDLPTDTFDSGIRNSESNFRMEKNILKVSRVIKPKDLSIWNLFKGFINNYSKIYNTKREILKRFRTYKRNTLIAKIWQSNEQGTAIYGETQFMDLTKEEFKKTYFPNKWEKPEYPDLFKVDLEDGYFLSHNELPQSFDWRTKGAVSEVKNQQMCGSCWAFSVTGNVEGQWAISKGKLISLSEQELLDCDAVDKACNGGLPINAYQEIIRMGGLELESVYPYDARKNVQCKLDREEIVAKISNWTQLPADEHKMSIFLFKSGPISVGVNANPLQFYRHGISHPWKIFCSSFFIDHGVLIVGYGVEGKKPFWIIKNSWGSSWGESGYYRLYRGLNVCGVATMATSSLV